MRLTLHHIGCLVENIPAALAAYPGGCFAGASEPVLVSSQKVRVCFLSSGNGTFIEFVEPQSDNAFLLRMLRRGVSYYHAGYLCQDLEECVRNFTSAGAHELTRFSSEAFQGRQCVFLVTPHQQMIELIEPA
jgi:hypothetical protein